MSFGYSGSKGLLCRSDLEEVPDGIVCLAEDSNPLQAAVDWAHQHNFRKVRLDAGEYTFNKSQQSWVGRIGFYIPSGIHLKGVLLDGEPGSVLMPSPEIDPKELTVPPSQQFEVLLLPSGDISDRSVPLVDTTIEGVLLNNRLWGGVCLWASGGSGFKLLQVHSQGSRQSSLIIGTWDDTREDPQFPFRASIYYMHNFEISSSHVHGANGDGICVIGKDGIVTHNLCENGTTLVDNGITTFIGSSGIRFINNQIENFPTAIGLDGAFMPCSQLKDVDDPAQSRDIGMQKLREVYQGWEGYHQNHVIANNVVRNCRRGIVLHRAREIHINGNHLIGRGIGEGIAIEEASGNLVWNNNVYGFNTALTLYAHENSGSDPEGRPTGTSFNKIGLTPSGDAVGNHFQSNNHGICLIKAHPAGRVSQNTLCNNDCRNCNIPFDFSQGEDDPGQIVSGNLPNLECEKWIPAKAQPMKPE